MSDKKKVGGAKYLLIRILYTLLYAVAIFLVSLLLSKLGLL